MDAFWRALHDAGADLILGGHDHNYERFAPQTPDSVSDSVGGMREFVVGTGGKDLRGRSFTPAHSEVFDYSAPGSSEADAQAERVRLGVQGDPW